jgi:hypothetical protein
MTYTAMKQISALRLCHTKPALKSGNVRLPRRVHGIDKVVATIFNSDGSHT